MWHYSLCNGWSVPSCTLLFLSHHMPVITQLHFSTIALSSPLQWLSHTTPVRQYFFIVQNGSAALYQVSMESHVEVVVQLLLKNILTVAFVKWHVCTAQYNSLRRTVLKLTIPYITDVQSVMYMNILSLHVALHATLNFMLHFLH